MKRLVWLLILAVPAVGLAQTPPDTAQRPEAERLRQAIERRFAERVQVELGLTADQAGKLRATQERYGERRRGTMRRQFGIRQALQWQMRPGVAASPDSVRRLMDALKAGRAELLKIEEDEDREMGGYLTPVQRAQFQMMRQRFLERVQEMRRERGRMMGPRDGGARPRARPPARRP